MTDDMKAPAELLQAQKLANLLDTAIKVPVVPLRFGLDPIVGLIPGAGDALMLLVSLRIVWLGKKLGLPKPLLYSMVRNAAIDFGLGFVPVIGDIMDVFFKANVKNVRLMETWWISQNKGAVDEATRRKLADWEAKLDAIERQ